MFKKILLFIIATLILLLFINWKIVTYGIQQGIGQLNIVYSAKPLKEYISDKNFPDSLKSKIKLVQKIKQFCQDSLGLEVGDNYQNLYNQNGLPAMWVVTASPPFELKSYEWSMSFLGNFSYKGYFKKERAEKEAEQLKQLGYDTDIDEVNAWSTLGWFKDPVMSSMLEGSEGQLARTLIHEITHYNIYVKNNVDYNENLATFIGDNGAKLFLAHHFGTNSKTYQDYLHFLSDIKIYADFMVKKSKELNQLYQNFNKSLNNTTKTKQKKEKINQIIKELSEIAFHKKERAKLILHKNSNINNTFFTDFLMYRKSTQEMENDFKNNYQSDIKKYIQHQKIKYKK